MKWCCKVFQSWFQTAGSRGIGVFAAGRSGNEPVFVLQSRALDPESPIPNTTYPISTVSEIRIQFCPWCGSNLKEVYDGSYGYLDRSDLAAALGGCD